MTFQIEPPITADEDALEWDEGVASVIPIRGEHETNPIEDIEAEIASATGRIAPLWSMRNFVAVNSFVGFADLDFADAVGEIDRLLHGQALMPVAFYREQLAAGRITPADLEVAIAEAPDALGRPDLADLPAERLQAALNEDAGPMPRHLARVETVAEAADRATGSRFARLIEHEIARWCAGRFDLGESSWPQPDRDLPLFSAWRLHASIDPSPEWTGLKGFRAYVDDLPDAPREVIAKVLTQLDVPVEARSALLTRQLASISGWAGHAQRLSHEAQLCGEQDDTLIQLLAVRLAFDGAVDRLVEKPEGWPLTPASHAELAARPLLDAGEQALVWQIAFERGYRRELLRSLAQGGDRRASTERKALQAVFCIDVRSEILRRHLEARSADIQTIGFAGFFGFAIEHVDVGASTGSARCPVLIPAGPRIRTGGSPSAEQGAIRARSGKQWMRKLRKLGVFAYPFVETLGFGFAARLVTDSFGWTRPGAPVPSSHLGPEIDAHDGFGLSPEQQVDLAEGALRNMGLTRDFAKIVLLCGHGSTSTNNPYASGLDCGACGGHAGDVNARVAAAVLQSPEVRSGLAERGIEIPEDTVFVAGLHDTTRDHVELFGADALAPTSRARLEQWLEVATAATRAERAPRLHEDASGPLGRRLGARARDWSEVRPEWGLANNAAFIAAPRAWTAGADLGGRAFLHDYASEKDAEKSVLTLILTAPLVVASWINLQYYASTTDNDRFGSGHKALHNVVGRHSVQLGNSSDLQVGLPWQSVHDGEKYAHEPMRLTAVIAAEPEHIDAVLAEHESIRSLVEHGWLHLMAWPEQDAPLRLRGATPGDWKQVEVAA